MEQARRILRVAGLPADGQLTPVRASWSNEVWLGQAHVVRIANRRGANSLQHELAVAEVLPPSVPYPHPVATGWDGADLWTVAPRLPGRPLYAAWVESGEEERAQITRSLVAAMKALHDVVLPPHLAHPPSLGGGDPVEPAKMPERVGRFLEEIRGLGLFAAEAAAAALNRLEQVEDAWRGGLDGCVHTDLSFDNAIWDGEGVWLLDLEWACTAPRDYELLWILAYCSAPGGFAEPEWTDAVAEADHADVPRLMKSFYPTLFAHPRLADRLTLFGLAAFARGWALRPDIWRGPQNEVHPSHGLAELVEGRGWLSLLPR